MIEFLGANSSKSRNPIAPCHPVCCLNPEDLAAVRFAIRGDSEHPDGGRCEAVIDGAVPHDAVDPQILSDRYRGDPKAKRAACSAQYFALTLKLLPFGSEFLLKPLHAARDVQSPVLDFPHGQFFAPIAPPYRATPGMPDAVRSQSRTPRTQDNNAFFVCGTHCLHLKPRQLGLYAIAKDQLQALGQLVAIHNRLHLLGNGRFALGFLDSKNQRTAMGIGERHDLFEVFTLRAIANRAAGDPCILLSVADRQTALELNLLAFRDASLDR